MALFSLGYKKKIEKLKQQLDAHNFEAAALLADEISIDKVKSAYELNLIGKAYKNSGDFLQAKYVYTRSYEMRCSRTVLLDIMDCCLEIRALEEIEYYFDEYHRVAPEDKVTQYVYRYRIEKKKGRERHLLISILEELKVLEYIEEYAYELAKQYHKAGMVQECMDECNDIILWFGFGPTVERAKTLLAYYRGEISLEEIKTAGVRYQEELTRQWQEEKERQAEEASQAAYEEVAAVEEVPEEVSEEKVFEEEVPEETALEENFDEEEFQEEEISEEEVLEAEACEETAYEAEEPDFVLPEIDMTGIYFEEDSPQTEPEVVTEKTAESVREEEEFYVPEVGELETQNERLADLILKKQIAVSEILKNFYRMERIRKQVVNSLELVLNDREKSYFVITGEPQTGKTTLAYGMVRLLYEMELVKYDRTATIDAVQLNQVSIMDYGEELKNCNLIIENAGGMTKESIDDLLRFSGRNKGKTCLILEDSVRDINKFLRAREELNSLFNNRIHLGKYTAEDLMGFAYDQIKKEDYCIDKMAAQVLRNKIDEIINEYGNDQRLARTMKLVDVIIARAEKRTGELLLTMAADGKIQQGNFMVITLNDVDA